MNKHLKLFNLLFLFGTSASLCSCSLSDLFNGGGKKPGGEEQQQQEDMTGTTLIDDVYYEVVDNEAHAIRFKNVNKINIKSEIQIEGQTYKVTTISYHNYKNNTLPIYFSNIKEINIPEGIKSIKKYGLAGLTSLSNLVLPNSLEEAEQGALYGTNALVNVSLPSFGSYDQFEETIDDYFKDDFDHRDYPSHEPKYFSDIYEAYPYMKNVMNFDLLFIKPKEKVDFHVFYSYQNDKLPNSFSLPKLQTISITSGKFIYPYSFSNLKGIKINFADSIESIFGCAFYRSQFVANLASVSQYANLKYETTFDYLPYVCSDILFNDAQISELEIPEGVKVIYPHQYSFSYSVTSLSLPTSLETIYPEGLDGLGNVKTSYYKYGFYYGNKVNPYLYLMYASEEAEDFVLHPDCKFLNNNAFDGSFRKLKSVTFNDYVTVIPSKMFYNFTTLKEVIFPGENNVVEIQKYAFSGTGLTSFSFSDKIKTIGQAAFSNCSNLKEVIFDEGITDLFIDEWGFEDDPIKNILIPNGSKLGPYAFSIDLASPVTLYIPEDIEYDYNPIEIGYKRDGAFYNPRILLGGRKSRYSDILYLLEDECNRWYGDIFEYNPEIYENVIVKEGVVYKNKASGYSAFGYIDENIGVLPEILSEIDGISVFEVNLTMSDYSALSYIRLPENCQSLTIKDDAPRSYIANKSLSIINCAVGKASSIYFEGNESEFLVENISDDVSVYFYSEYENCDGKHFHYGKDGKPEIWF